MGVAADAARSLLLDMYHRHAPGIAAYLRHTGAVGDVAHLLAGVFALAQCALDECRAAPDDLDLPWLLRAARNHRDRGATHGRRHGAGSRAMASPVADPLAGPLRALPVAQREVLFLRCGLALDSVATARAVGQAVAEVQSILVAALVALTGVISLPNDPDGNAALDGHIDGFLAGRPTPLPAPIQDLIWNLRHSFAPNFADQAAAVRGWSRLTPLLAPRATAP
jgi:hypothetical protein